MANCSKESGTKRKATAILLIVYCSLYELITLLRPRYNADHIYEGGC